jgi:hypothetical protein
MATGVGFGFGFLLLFGGGVGVVCSFVFSGLGFELRDFSLLGK